MSAQQVKLATKFEQDTVTVESDTTTYACPVSIYIDAGVDQEKAYVRLSRKQARKIALELLKAAERR